MSGRTAFQVYVYECPEDQREAAIGAIREVAGDPDESGDHPREGFTFYESRPGTAQDVAGKLVEVAPGVSFYLWEDPAYEYLGDMYAYTPGLGRFAAQCDSYGEPVFGCSRVLEMLRQAGGDIEALRRAMGAPWVEDWMAHNATPVPNGNG